jgi:hypothetical protein
MGVICEICLMSSEAIHIYLLEISKKLYAPLSKINLSLSIL